MLDPSLKEFLLFFPIHLGFLLVVKGSIRQLLPTKQDTETAASKPVTRGIPGSGEGLGENTAKKEATVRNVPPWPEPLPANSPFLSGATWAQPRPQVSIYTPSIADSRFHGTPKPEERDYFSAVTSFSFNKRPNHRWFAKCHGNPRARSEIICQYSFILRSLFKNYS